MSEQTEEKQGEEKQGEKQGVLAPEEMRLLAEVGFMAAGAGHIRAARGIFNALMVLRPNRTAPYVGMAMTEICAGAPENAVRVLRDNGLRMNPDSDEILAFLGFALNIAQRSAESERVLTNMLAKEAPEAPESPERVFAKRLLSAGSGASPFKIKMPEENKADNKADNNKAEKRETLT